MINRMTGKVFISLCMLIYLAGCSKTPPISDTNDPIKSKTEQSYGVSSSNPIAIDVGMEILDNGGTAADAAIAVSYVLGVVEPFGWRGWWRRYADYPWIRRPQFYRLS